VHRPQDPRRIPNHAHNGGDILGHHAARPDSDAPPNRHPREEDDAPAKLTVLADGDGLAHFRTARAVSEAGVQGIGVAVE